MKKFLKMLSIFIIGAPTITIINNIDCCNYSESLSNILPVNNLSKVYVGLAKLPNIDTTISDTKGKLYKLDNSITISLTKITNFVDGVHSLTIGINDSLFVRIHSTANGDKLYKVDNTTNIQLIFLILAKVICSM